MKFDFNRSGVTWKGTFSCRKRNGRGGVYLLHSIAYGLVRVPRRKLRVEVHPEIGEHTGAVLLDFVGDQRSGVNQAVIAAEDALKLRMYFARNSIKFPGISPTK